MIEVEVSEAANVDLDAIYEYSADTFGEATADAYLRRFQSVYAMIGEHPLAGAVHDRVRPPIRSVPCGSHRVFYDVMEDRVVVRRILHQAMDVGRWLADG